MTRAKCTIKLEMFRVIKKCLSNGVDNVLKKKKREKMIYYASDFNLVNVSTLLVQFSFLKLNEQVQFAERTIPRIADLITGQQLLSTFNMSMIFFSYGVEFLSFPYYTQVISEMAQILQFI